MFLFVFCQARQASAAYIYIRYMRVFHSKKNPFKTTHVLYTNAWYFNIDKGQSITWLFDTNNNSIAISCKKVKIYLYKIAFFEWNLHLKHRPAQSSIEEQDTKNNNQDKWQAQNS